jgi:hypothetical protein
MGVWQPEGHKRFPKLGLALTPPSPFGRGGIGDLIGCEDDVVTEAGSGAYIREGFLREAISL